MNSTESKGRGGNVLYAEMTASRPSVQGGKPVKIVAVRMSPAVCEGLESGQLLTTASVVFGFNNDGAMCGRLLGIVPRELLHPEATLGFRVANQFGSVWEHGQSRSKAREDAERLFSRDRR